VFALDDISAKESKFADYADILKDKLVKHDIVRLLLFDVVWQGFHSRLCCMQLHVDNRALVSNCCHPAVMNRKEMLKNADPALAREYFSLQAYSGPTCGICEGYLQANVVILHQTYAADFLKFCHLNPQPVPLLEVLSAGNAFTNQLASKADIRCCLPKYRQYSRDEQSGKVVFVELKDISSLWNDKLVTFFLGCSFSFEHALEKQFGEQLRHNKLNCNVPMYNTNIKTNNVNGIGSYMVVSMRPLKKELVKDAYRITQPLVQAHSSPVHFGDPKCIGIEDFDQPDFGDKVPIYQGELPVFWACGITTHVALMHAIECGAIDSVITHAPGHMFISDRIVSASKL